MKPKLIALLVLIVLFVILIVQNSNPIEVNIFFWTIFMSQAIIFFLILIIGVISGYLIAKIEQKAKKGVH